MTKLSEIDKKLVYELGNNARFTYRELAKKLKSKKTVVAYHFNKLVDEKVIWKFVPVVSLTRLGIFGHKIFLKLHGVTKEQREKMFADLVSNKEVCWVAECTGNWDLIVAYYSSSINGLALQKNTFFREYGKYIHEYSISILEDALVFNRDYLSKKNLEYRKEFVFGGKSEVEAIDNDQKSILRLIANDGRYQVTALAKKLKLNVRTVISKIRNLEKRGIIQGYTTFLDINKIGLKFFKLAIYMQDFTLKNYNILLNFCKENRNTIHMIKSIGDWELELEIEVQDVDEIYEYINDLKTNFPHVIKKIEVAAIVKEHKLEFFPQWY